MPSVNDAKFPAFVRSVRSELSRRLKVLLIVLLLTCLTFAVYLQTVHFEFAGLDLQKVLLENSYVREGLSARGIAWAFSTIIAGTWVPVAWVGQMTVVSVFGFSPGAHHLVNLLLHLTNVLILFFIVLRMLGSIPRAVFVAALFAIHPLNCEPVACVVLLRDLLSALFGLAAIFFYVRRVGGPRRSRWPLVEFCFAISLMAKPMLVTLPLLLLVLDGWPLARWRSLSVRELVLEKTPLFVIALADALLTFFAAHRAGAVASVEYLPPGNRIANAVLSYASYLGNTFWPTGLALFYPHPGRAVATGPAVAVALTMAIVAWWALRNVRRFPSLAAGGSWFFVSLLPVIGIIQAGSHARADRYAYLPLIGVFLAVAAIPPARRLAPTLRTSAGIIAAICVAVLAAVAYRQTGFWRNDVVLYSHAIAVTEGNVNSYVNLAEVLRREGRLTEAREKLNEAFRIGDRSQESNEALAGRERAPGMSAAPSAGVATNASSSTASEPELLHEGYRLAGLGRTDEAILKYREALRQHPDSPEAHCFLGTLLAQQQRNAEAEAEFRAALRANPLFSAAHRRLGNLLSRLGRTEEAINSYMTLLTLQPQNVEAHTNLGIALFKVGRVREAAASFRRAFNINPDYATARNNLGNALLQLGEAEEAIAIFREAARLHPNDAAAHTNLAIAYRAAGRTNDALAEMEVADRLAPR